MKSFTIYLICLIVLLLLAVAGVVYFDIIEKINTPKQATTTVPVAQTSTPEPPVPETVMVAEGTSGQFLVGTTGKTLYYFTKDTTSKSNCTGPCIANWPVFFTENFIVSNPLKSSDFLNIIGAGQKEQTTYKGLPLYYYVKDIIPGDTKGDGVGGVWFMARP